jgi:hypothetical protein
MKSCQGDNASDCGDDDAMGAVDPGVMAGKAPEEAICKRRDEA